MQVKKKEVETKILEEAAFLFLRKGMKNTTLKMIAERAHTTISNIYCYFPSKFAILDRIAEKVVIDMDLFIERKYKTILQMAFEANFYERLIKVIEEEEDLSYILGSKLVMIVENCQGVKYEYYKESLLEVLEHHGQCYFEDKYPDMMYRLIAHTFLQALLEIGKLRIDEIERGIRKQVTDHGNRGVRYSNCRFWREDEKKQVICYFDGYVNMDEKSLSTFFEEYDANLKGICTSEYSAHYDCRNLRVGVLGPNGEKFVRAYKASNFKHNVFVFTHKQTILAAQLEYVCKTVGLENYEIIMEHNVTRKTF